LYIVKFNMLVGFFLLYLSNILLKLSENVNWQFQIFMYLYFIITSFFIYTISIWILISLH